ncbi:Predicted protein [Komagataella phaffii CBS 7435]|nr:Predicted protein [Komagataella phaffii CBS 7435]
MCRGYLLLIPSGHCCAYKKKPTTKQGYLSPPGLFSPVLQVLQSLAECLMSTYTVNNLPF